MRKYSAEACCISKFNYSLHTHCFIGVHQSFNYFVRYVYDMEISIFLKEHYHNKKSHLKKNSWNDLISINLFKENVKNNSATLPAFIKMLPDNFPKRLHRWDHRYKMATFVTITFAIKQFAKKNQHVHSLNIIIVIKSYHFFSFFIKEELKWQRYTRETQFMYRVHWSVRHEDRDHLVGNIKWGISDVAGNSNPCPVSGKFHLNFCLQEKPILISFEHAFKSIAINEIYKYRSFLMVINATTSFPILNLSVSLFLTRLFLPWN